MTETKVKLTLRLKPAIAKKFKVSLAKKGESAQKVLEERVMEYLK